MSMSPILLKNVEFQIQKDHVAKYQTRYVHFDDTMIV